MQDGSKMCGQSHSQPAAALKQGGKTEVAQTAGSNQELFLRVIILRHLLSFYSHACKLPGTSLEELRKQLFLFLGSLLPLLLPDLGSCR